VQLAWSDAQRLLARHAVKVRACRQQRAIAATPHIVHNAPRLPLHAIQTCRSTLIERLQQPLHLSGPGTAGCH
jgi:hypothetical protein